MSMYAVNASIPKTLVRHLVAHVAGDKAGEDEALSHVLEDILDTPVSPELLPAIEGEIAQRTEDIVGPYELPGRCCGWPSRPSAAGMIGPPCSSG